MSENKRNSHVAPNGLLSLGNINGLLQEVNGQHVVGNPMARAKEEQNKSSDMKTPSAPKKKQSSKAENKVEVKPSKLHRSTDTFEYIASILSKSEHRIDRKTDRVAYIRPEIISAFRQSYREKATQAINEVLRNISRITKTDSVNSVLKKALSSTNKIIRYEQNQKDNGKEDMDTRTRH